MSELNTRLRLTGQARSLMDEAFARLELYVSAVECDALAYIKSLFPVRPAERFELEDEDFQEFILEGVAKKTEFRHGPYWFVVDERLVRGQIVPDVHLVHPEETLAGKIYQLVRTIYLALTRALVEDLEQEAQTFIEGMQDLLNTQEMRVA